MQAAAYAHVINLNRLREGARRVNGVIKLERDLRTFEVVRSAAAVFSDATLDTGCGSPRILVFFVLVSTAEDSPPEPTLLSAHRP